MYYLESKKICLQNMVLLAARQGQQPARDAEEFKSLYLDFLRSHIGGETVPTIEEDQYCYDMDRIRKLLNKYTGNCDLTDLPTTVDKTPISAMKEALSVIKDGKPYLEIVNSDLHELFDLVIHTLFYFRSSEAGGGSASSAIGTIWCSNRQKWTKQDVAEFLVHELAHNLVFIDELCHKHYVDLKEIAKKENYAQSAILNMQRPLDKVFHSLIVGYEVLKFREETGEPSNPVVHPPSSEVRAACLRTIESIDNVIKDKDIVTDRFVYLLNSIRSQFEEVRIAA